MKKILASSLIVSAIILSTAFSCKAAVVEKDEGYVSVTTSETKEVAPDQAQITVNIETSDKSLQKAAADNKIIADKVYSSLKAILNTEKGDYIKTANYSANPVYTYSKDNKRVFDKYVVSNNVVVRTKNTALSAKLVDTAIAAGATNVNDLQFLVADYDSACDEILAQLTKRAYSQASSIANAINAKIIGTKSIASSCNPENTSRPQYSMMAKSSVGSESSTPIESGKVKIYATINAEFYVK
jgi:uncharacterized protein YggE